MAANVVSDTFPEDDDFDHPLSSSYSDGRRRGANTVEKTAMNKAHIPQHASTSTSVVEDDWVKWYQSTFSQELAMINTHGEAENYDPLGKQIPSSPSKSALVLFREARHNKHQTHHHQPASSEMESRILRRRLDAVDSIQALLVQIDAVGVHPIPRRLWEEDSKTCTSCERDLGWTHLRRRHHCRYCGLTFCDDCTCGEIRRCTYCTVQKTRSDCVKMLRNNERQVVQDGFPKDAITAVAKTYRVAIQLFSNQPRDAAGRVKQARQVLIEGMQSFLELAEFKLNSST